MQTLSVSRESVSLNTEGRLSLFRVCYQVMCSITRVEMVRGEALAGIISSHTTSVLSSIRNKHMVPT
jgi:hypothetical protein